MSEGGGRPGDLGEHAVDPWADAAVTRGTWAAWLSAAVIAIAIAACGDIDSNKKVTILVVSALPMLVLAALGLQGWRRRRSTTAPPGPAHRSAATSHAKTAQMVSGAAVLVLLALIPLYQASKPPEVPVAWVLACFEQRHEAADDGGPEFTWRDWELCTEVPGKDEPDHPKVWEISGWLAWMAIAMAMATALQSTRVRTLEARDDARERANLLAALSAAQRPPGGEDVLAWVVSARRAAHGRRRRSLARAERTIRRQIAVGRQADQMEG